jgi:hypothetical protein
MPQLISMPTTGEQKKGTYSSLPNISKTPPTEPIRLQSGSRNSTPNGWSSSSSSSSKSTPYAYANGEELYGFPTPAVVDEHLDSFAFLLFLVGALF